MNITVPYQLFANCITVKGAKNFTIIDTQREEVYILPNELYQITINKNQYNLGEIIDQYPSDSKKVIIDFFNFLDQNELIFTSKDFQKFPKLNSSWDFPSKLTNGILVLSFQLIDFYGKVVEDLSKMLCNYLEVWVIEEVISLDKLISFLNLFDKSTIVSIDLKIKNKNSKFNQFKSLLDKFPRISEIHIYNSKKSLSKANNRIIHFSNDLNLQYCGKISDAFFFS